MGASVTIDPKWIDVDFARQPEFVVGNLGFRGDKGRFAKYSDVAQVHPESQWKELIAAMDADGGGLDRCVSRIYNQRNEGSCVANAFGQANEIVQFRQFGKALVTALSAISLYKRIGRSPSSGAMVDDGMEESSSRGILPLDTPENRAKFGNHVMPPTGFSTPYPDGWEATAAKFKTLEWTVCDSVPELISALINGHPVVVGRSGHSICYTRPMFKDGSLVVKYANSWSPEWGDGGFGYDSQGLIRSSAGWCCALRSTTDWRT
jgi:hypothetical protein